MASRKPLRRPTIDYLIKHPYGGGSPGVGQVPFYEGITDEQYEKITATISNGVSVVSAIMLHVITSDSAIRKARQYGRAMIEKWQKGEDVTESEVENEEGAIVTVTHLAHHREAAAMKFEVLISRAQCRKVENLTHRAQCNHVEYTGIDGVVRVANIEGARQAMVLLDRIPEASEVEPVEVEEKPTIAPSEAEVESIARAYLAKRGIDLPSDGYDPATAAPANVD